MKIISEGETPLLSRKRYSIEVEHFDSATPKKDGLKKEVAKLLNVNEDLVVVRHVYTKYGYGKSKIIVHVYNKVEDLQRLEKKKERKEKPKEVKEKDGKEKGKEQKA